MSKKPPSSDRIVLKILSGTQSGAEVALEPGDYTLGAGSDDDIQLVDISLTPGHAKLRISATKIEILGANGSLVSAKGVAFPANGDTWSELEPLEIVAAGTTRFALGPVHANWTTLSEASIATLAQPKAEDKTAAGWRRGGRQAHRYANFGIMTVLALILIAVVYQQWNTGALVPRAKGPGSVAALKNALSALPFANAVSVREDVDGTIYASGLVETAVDRRAVAAVAEKLSIPLRLRLGVRQTMRAEIDTMIASMKVPVVADLAPDGVLRLDGVILKDDVATQFVDRLKTDVSGIAQIDNHIRTAKSLVVEIEKLAKKVQIDSFVIFRLENQAIEVNGILPLEKIDAWVGFIQAYSKNFAKDIALRSYVQLQAADSVATQPVAGGPAISIGPQDRNSTDIVLDMDRIRRGLFELSDLFVGLKRKQAAVAEVTAAAPAPETKPVASERPPTVASREDWQLGGSLTASAAETVTKPVSEAKPGVEAAPGALFGTQAYAGEIPKASDRLIAGLIGAKVAASPAGVANLASLVPDGKIPASVTPTGQTSATADQTAVGTTTAGNDRIGLADPAKATVSLPIGDTHALAGQTAAGTTTAGNDRIALADPAKATVSLPIGDTHALVGQTAAGTTTAGHDRIGLADPAKATVSLPIGDTHALVGPTTASPTTASPTTASTTTADVGEAAVSAPPVGLPIASQPAAAAVGKGHSQPVATAPSTTLSLTEAANKLIGRWLSGLGGKAELPVGIQSTLDRIAETRASIDPVGTAEPDSKPRYLPLIATDLPDGATREACWPGSRLTSGNMPTALFWLDVLSLTQQLSLKTFTFEEQRFLLEAAANPGRVRQCMAEKGGNSQIALTSLYLNEASRNPDFIRFVVRDLVATDVDIAGINLSQDRFLQTRDGVKHREGTALDIGRRILSVGELAAIIRTNDGYSVIPYGIEVNWVLTSR